MTVCWEWKGELTQNASRLLDVSAYGGARDAGLKDGGNLGCGCERGQE